MNIEILDYSEAYRKKTGIQLSLLQESLSFCTGINWRAVELMIYNFLQGWIVNREITSNFLLCIIFQRCLDTLRERRERISHTSLKVRIISRTLAFSSLIILGYLSFRVIHCYQLSWKRKLTTVKSLKPDVSSVSPSLIALTKNETKRNVSLLTVTNLRFNSFDNTKLPCYTLPPTHHHSFFRNLFPFFIYFPLTPAKPMWRRKSSVGGGKSFNFLWYPVGVNYSSSYTNRLKFNLSEGDEHSCLLHTWYSLLQR